jgi:hypothetical protein
MMPDPEHIGECRSADMALVHEPPRPRCPRRNVGVMGRADRERVLAEHERRLAQVERNLVENRDRDELTHFRAMHTHERAAEIHDALADFFPDADD